METIIDLQNVSYLYNQGSNKEHLALNNVSLEISKGEFVAIIGRNGSGKSTLSKLLNGLLLPSDGQIFVNGIDTSDSDNIWDVRQKVGMVFQNPDNQIVATTVEEDVAFGLENLGIDSNTMKQRIGEALSSVGMEQYREYPPHLLSGGQKQRIAIAGIIAMRPEVLVFDEPTAMLDPKGRNEVVETVLKLNNEGITVAYVTHFMEEVVSADRIVVMDQGEIKLSGTPQKIFQHVDQVREIGLDVPQIVELGFKLRKSGIEIPEDVLTVEELVNALC
ncbi:energy-coupling factor transporter ATPase [Natranaerobius trueperi]|uniref:Energy-coupling factor transporter ATPase n=1 Tax=Natranaerobius trueperi TaxID=759412 RepID=A0A226C250_9FIRM|nr:energy-coupling factor transporter ATPase [Natranaerobius trueperi]OWZ84460.1 energy-coupling factor transporter ATPase [Natranaerobius trueperi]